MHPGRGAPSRARRSSPIRPIRQTVAANTPTPPPISMPYRPATPCARLRSRPSGTRTVVSSGSRWPSAANSRKPSAASPACSAGLRVPGVDGVETLLEHPAQPGVQRRRPWPVGRGVVVGPPARSGRLAGVAAQHPEVEVPGCGLLIRRSHARSLMVNGASRGRRRGTSASRSRRGRHPTRPAAPARRRARSRSRPAAARRPCRRPAARGRTARRWRSRRAPRR